MKTMKFRLLATMITLAAVTTATIPSNAQRRSTSDRNENRKTENTRSANKSVIEKKSGSRDNVKESKAALHTVKSNTDVRRNNPSAAKEMKKEVSRTADYMREMKNSRAAGQYNTKKSDKNYSTSRERVSNSSQSDNNHSKSNDKAIVSTSEMSRRSTGSSVESRRSTEKDVYNKNRSVSSENSERYNLNRDDDRYKPNKEYRGSNNYWSSDIRNDNRSNRHSNEKYDYNHYNHWNRNWENYRWNHNSWMNYYSYYDPYAFRHHKYYYHHPYYGHVIRKFVYRPQVYIHNHNKYYCYDGYFFRYRSGIGYILVDVPFGMAFDFLPYDFERVYINGYLYFRVGNLFFEYTNYGYQLIHYPERYFAFNDGYSHEGFRFNDMNY